MNPIPTVPLAPTPPDCPTQEHGPAASEARRPRQPTAVRESATVGPRGEDAMTVQDTYAGARTICDADSHLMELPEWLPSYADPDVRDRIRPLHLGGAGALA